MRCNAAGIPTQVTDWFHRAFVDGYDWVMVPNVIGMSQYADGGQITSAPRAGIRRRRAGP